MTVLTLALIATLASTDGSHPAAPSPQTPQTPPAAPATPGSGQPTPGPSVPRMPGAPGMPARDARLTPPATGTAAIRGRVVALDTGAPLRRVRVRINGEGIATSRGAQTDAQGQYEIANIPAGRYFLTASKGGFVDIRYGQRRPLDMGRPIEIADGQKIDKVDFHLPRGGVIVGRVVDEYGEPVSDTGVSAMVYRRWNGRRRLTPASRGAATDDLGQFRVYGLPPGEYYVAANFRQFTGGTDVEDSTGYAPTYYPGTVSLADATRVAVQIGEEVRVDLQLIPTRVSKITGTVTDASGRAVSLGMVGLQVRDEVQAGPMMMNNARIKSDGTFTIANATPGTYHLTAMAMPTSENFELRETGSIPITIAGQDIENVRIVVSPGSTIQGRITFEGGPPPPTGDGHLRIMCVFTDQSPILMGGVGAATVDEKGQFTLKGVHSACRLTPGPSSAGWLLERVTLDGRDITDEPLQIVSGKNVTGVEIVLTNRKTTLSGSVSDNSGRPIKDYAVVIFPDDEAKWTTGSRYVRSARPDQDGQFKVTGLPPGEYLAVAVESWEPGDETDPEQLGRLRPLGTKTRLTDDAPAMVTLKLSTVAQ